MVGKNWGWGKMGRVHSRENVAFFTKTNKRLLTKERVFATFQLMGTKGERTKERILQTAIRLFSDNGVQGTSIRTIARAINMNEASLYNHFTGKDDIFDHIIRRFSENLIVSGLETPDSNRMDPSKSLFELIWEDAEKFFQKTRNEEARQVWRILMMEQFTHHVAADFIVKSIIRAPEAHIHRLLVELRSIGKIPAGLDLLPLSRSLAALFLRYSLSSNILSYWQHDAEPESVQLIEDLKEFCKLISNESI